jgi:hypothetical protein
MGVKKRETLASAVVHLEQALAGDLARRPHDWAARVEQALTGLERAVRRQDAQLESPDGGVVEVGSGQAPSPGMHRRLGRLHEDLTGFLDEVGALRGRARQVREGNPDVTDGLRRRAADLLGALRRYERDEARVIFETASTDIGAGD